MTTESFQTSEDGGRTLVRLFTAICLGHLDVSKFQYDDTEMDTKKLFVKYLFFKH